MLIGSYRATDADMDTLTWSLEGADASSFTLTPSNDIPPSQDLVFRSSPDFETPADTGGDNVYNVTVKVSDDESPALSATVPVTVTVNNLQEDGMVTITCTGTLSEGELLTATLDDPDGEPTTGTVMWQWARGSTASGSFSDINGATSSSYTLAAEDVGQYLQATVTYGDPASHIEEPQPASAVSGPVAAGNAKPTFDDDDDTTRTVPENNEGGTNVGAAITASDSDMDDTLTYSLGGTDADSFDIDDSTGQITTQGGRYLRLRGYGAYEEHLRSHRERA